MQALKILIVEDQRMVAANVKEYLEEIGYQVEVAFDYQGGLQCFQMFQPDLVLLDIQLSNLPNQPDGVDLAIEISNLKDTPFIFLSGNATDHQLRKRAKAANPAAFLVKPPNMLQIAVAIELAIEADKKTEGTIKNHLFIKNGKAFQRIELNELGWIKAARNWSEIILENETLHVSSNLSNIEKSFSHPRILRIHKSYIVNLNKIIKTKGNLITLKAGKNEIKLTIGRIYRDQFWESFSPNS